MELSVQNLYGLLVRSKLLTTSDAQAMIERWHSAGKEPSNIDLFARWMVANGYVTEYQASLLARGHAEGFFLNQYKILDRIGRGRMAGVYKAVHPSGQIVAIKVLPPSKAKDPQLFGRFQREARLSVTLKHPNVVRTFQVGEASGLHYLVMEHLEGETMDEVLQRRGKLKPAEAVPIVHQALLGLQHLYEKGMVHRDLKPANLMLLRPGPGGNSDDPALLTVKILDIGLARALADGGSPEKPDGPELTAEGLLLGTPDYMSPEQAREARSVDIRADIYSLGCVLYHALAGQPPFPDTNIISQMIRHASEPIRPLSDFNPAVPDGLQQIVNWMMAKEAAQRYPTPERAASALQVFLAARAGDAKDQAPDEKMSSYLTWLDAEERARKEKAGTETAAQHEEIPDVLAVPTQAELAGAVVPSAPAGPVKAYRPRADAAPQTMTMHRPVAREGSDVRTPVQPARPIVPEVEPVFDVELLPTPAPAEAEAGISRDHLRLRRRDFLMFGIGSATVILALAVGKVLAWLFPIKKPAPSPPSDEPEPNRE
jgi:eukaryotic-like serine/threonine-protein kinase